MTKQKNAALIFIFITMLIDVIGIGIIVPVIPKIIEKLIGGNLSQAAVYGGWLTFSYSIMQFIFSPILGGLSDQYGRRPVIMFSLFGFAIDYLLLGFAPTIVWIFIGRIISGITGASFTTAGAYIADVSPPEKKAQNFGLIGAAFGLGFILGPVIGGLLAPYGERLPFFVAAALSFANWLYGYFVLPESLKPENRRPFDWKRANPVGSLLQLKKYPVITALILPLILIYIANFATQGTWTYYVMYKFHWNETWVGYSLGFVGLMAAIVQGGLTRSLIPKLGVNKAVFLGLICAFISYILYGLAYEGWQMFAFTVIGSLGGLAMPALQAIMSNEVPANEQGELRGALTSLMSLTAVVGPVIMTALFGYFTSPKAPIQLAGAPYFLAALLMIVSLFLIAKRIEKPINKIE